ncbi:histidine kinase-like ATPase [Halteromyces radiatus]|uniref:histidine kinase-like ATPase n=1 Tax=Halteromyces radiatus TaxID=101107 RepID=UPI00221E8CF1|nr:histidine kinase-like ATPase [Halteromyces radiatus]KAI8097472.1 histidine kinase-like ATPase [Halteromyces radiatus]
MSTLPSIKRLDPTVINRIAAGEIIQRPANALKELIENSLDAGSTQIQIQAKEGGLKLLQIQDNGHGIKKEDLAIVCERYTTSKLKKFEDLSTIATYGFRGEALASISHVAHVTITTKTEDSKCAYRANYTDGKLAPPRPGQSADPKPCAGNNGTQITAEDLFYNMPQRKKALRSASDEYNRILDIVGRYAIHNAGVSFSCKRQGSMTADIQTTTTATIIDNIRQIHGSSVATELLYGERTFESQAFTMKSYISNANYSVKRTTLLLFINNRSVESPAIKRMIENVYSALLPKGGHPFVYLSILIKPENVDVNVHPTKQVVNFLNEEWIINSIQEVFQELLENANSSRTFYTQSLLPGAPATNADNSLFSTSTNKVAVYHQVRTDSRTTTMDSFLTGPIASYGTQSSISSIQDDANGTKRTNDVLEEEKNDEDVDMDTDSTLTYNKPSDTGVTSKADGSVDLVSKSQKRIKRDRVEVTLTSVLTLRKNVKKSEHIGMTDLLSNHTFVGCVDDTLALIQHQTSLYLVNYAVISEELFYQIALAEFNNFGFIELSTPISIKECISIALDTEEAYGTLPPQLQSKEQVAEIIVSKLMEFATMLEDYFSMLVNSEGQLMALPMLLRGYIPTMDKLPMFLLRLGTEVDWEDEQTCLDTLSREIAIFYSTEPPSPLPDNPAEYKRRHDRYLWQIQHLIFPAMKTTRFIAPKSLVRDGSSYITQLASLSDLYKIFERC